MNSGFFTRTTRTFSDYSDTLFYRADAASFAFFRICFGFIMLLECFRFYRHDWIARYFIEPQFLFKYYGFEWVQPLPGDGMYWLFAALALLSLNIMLGCFYRLSCWLFLLCFSYVFLLDQARYLNHFYFVMILALVLAVTPAHHVWSLDAWRRKPVSGTVPWWSVLLFRANMEIVLIFAGVVKITSDWLQLEPMGMWLARRDYFALELAFGDVTLLEWRYGLLFNQDNLVAIAAYSAIAIHLVCGPLLLWRRTRLAAVAVYCLFHLSNHFLFTIGIFPWMTIASTLIFLDPDWPRKALHYVRFQAGWQLPFAAATLGGLCGLLSVLIVPKYDAGFKHFFTVGAWVCLAVTIGLLWILFRRSKAANGPTATVPETLAMREPQ